MDRVMESLYQRCMPLLHSRWFEWLMAVIIFANPLAILPQLITVFTAPNVDGISIFMWYIFATIQAAFTCHGIKTKSAPVFLSMLVSCLESSTIIAVVHIRG